MQISDVMTVKCPICGRPYKIWSTMSGDQSACPRCQREAERADNYSRPDTYEEYTRRMNYFYGRDNSIDPRSTHYYINTPKTTDINNEPNFHPDWGSFS